MCITKEALMAWKTKLQDQRAQSQAKAQMATATFTGAMLFADVLMAEADAAEADVEAEVFSEGPEMPPDEVVQEAREWLESPEGSAVIANWENAEYASSEPVEPCEGDCGMDEAATYDMGY